MTTTPGTGLLEAGLAPLDATADGATDAVRARAYTHPMLGGRTVVRLVPDTLAPAEDAALDFLGFTVEDASEPLALARPRGLGYPEWALVNDPERRAEALALVRPMERAARLAANRPGPASDEFARIAEGVPLHHLPSYWEQAGRAFVAAGNARTAAVMFGRAREAERVYSLPVDEATRREAFLEFAFAGALTVKALAGHAAELAARYEPARAYAEFRELSVRRTLGGLPPWTGLPKQIRSLAGAAGLDPAEEESAVLRELLTVPATSSAPEGFWRAARPGLVALGRSDGDAARALLGLFVSGGSAFQQWWLEMLDDAGAVDLLADPARPVPGGAAAWFSRMVSHCRGWRRSVPGRLLELVPRLADRLRADGDPVGLGGRGSRFRGEVSPVLLDMCLELGVPVLPPEEAALDLESWVVDRGGAPRRDLAHVRADPVWEPVLAASAAGYGRHHSRVLDELLPYEYLHPYVDRRLGELVGAMGGTALAQLGIHLEQLRSEVGGDAFRAFPDRLAQLESVDVAAALAATLRAGIVGEYAWEALEEAARELGATGTGKGPGISGTASWPVLTLASVAKVIAVGPRGRVAEHTPRLPAGAKDVRAVYADGALLVVYRVDYENRGYWTTDPDTVLTFPGYGSAVHSWGSRGGSPGIAQLTADGARMGGHRAVRAGDDPGKADRHVLGDGRTHWVLDRGRLHEADPATGDRGRRSLPAFLEDQPLAEGELLLEHACTLGPLDEPTEGSPLGAADGVAGFAVVGLGRGAGGAAFRITAPDGRSAEVRVPAGRGRHLYAASTPAALFTAPGGATHALSGAGGATLLAADGSGQIWSCHTGTACECNAKWGVPYLPEPVFWHFMTARDPRSSALLRRVSAADLGPLLDAAESERRASRTPGTELTRKSAGALLSEDGAAPDTSLVWNVTGLAHSAAGIRAELGEYLTGTRRTVERAPRRPESEPLARGLHRFLPDLGRGDHDARAHLEATSRFLRGEADAGELADRPRTSADWSVLLGRIGALAWQAALPGVAEDERAALLDFLRRWSGTLFADRGATVETGRVVGGEEFTTLAGEGVRRADMGFRSRVPGPEARFGKHSTLHTFVEAGTGAAPPAESPEAGYERRRADLAWGDAAQLTAFTAAVAEHGPVPWDPGAAEALAEDTGLVPEAAELLLRAPWRVGAGAVPDLARRELGLSAVGARFAAEEFAGVTAQDVLDLYSEALPETPEGIAALWGPGGVSGVAERVARAWNARFGRRSALPESTLTAFGASGLDRVCLQRLRLLADHTGEAALTRDAVSELRLSRGRHHDSTELLHTPVEAGRLSAVLVDLAHLIPWACAELPAGDPVREGVPATLAAVRERLSAPGLLLGAGAMWVTDVRRRLEEAGGEPYRDSAGGAPFAESADNGVAVLTSVGRGVVQVWFRPSGLGQDVRSRVLRSVVADGSGYGGQGVLAEVELLLSEGFAALAERVSSGELPEGAKEHDPAASAPGVLEEARAELGLSPDAARLYLQLLTLLEPTDRRIRAVNGWTPARHKKVQAELAATDLVLTAKRSRSGRSVFVPGPWTDAKAPNLPYEAWKLPLYDLGAGRNRLPSGRLVRFHATRPLPDLFAEAWGRFRDGDRPGR
ncbi:hypothetical protein ACIRPH_27550 [Nocardiopsis sp. NPDC101807]|uniref:hypothetical protein n=1 Tax=Nocardiopsis sp. NPDC101807 TaxID=3364339 RepID=UPI00381FD644